MRTRQQIDQDYTAECIQVGHKQTQVLNLQKQIKKLQEQVAEHQSRADFFSMEPALPPAPTPPALAAVPQEEVKNGEA